MSETIIQAAGVADIEAARALFLEYEKSLGIDLAFQDFDRELADLPGEYSRRPAPSCWQSTTGS